MSAKDYIKLFLEEDKKIMELYLMFAYYAKDKNNPAIKNYYLVNLNNEFITSISKNCLLYFLIIILNCNNTIFDIISKHDIDFKMKFNSVLANEKLNELLYKIKSGEDFVFDEDIYLSDYNRCAINIVMGYSNINKPICIERIFYNMIRENLFKCVNLNFDSLLEDLNEIAVKKEKAQKVAPAVIVKKEDNGSQEEFAQPKENTFNGEIKSSKEKKDTTCTKSSQEIPYGKLLTKKHYEYNPLIGRKKEFRKMCAGLIDEEKSVIIHGAAGVGKTTLVNGLAYQIQEGIAPIPFRDKEILEVSGSDMINGCKYIGMFEARMKEIIDYLLASPNTILFIDEIHTLMGLGQGRNDNNDGANILKPYLGDGRIKIIGATTTDEYSLINENAAFGRRFNGVLIPELKDNEIFEILEKTIERYQEKKGIVVPYDKEITKALLNLIITFSKRKMTNVKLGKELHNPDLALTILRNGYNYTLLDGEDNLSVASIIEGLDSMDYFGDAAKEEFEQKAMSLTRKLTSLK